MSDSQSLTADAQLDLRGTPCPINFVRTKLQLKKMSPNAVLEVWLDAGEPMEQVPDSLTMEGYVVEQAIAQPEGHYALWVRCPVA